MKRITFGRKAVDVFTADGAIRADRVIVATGAPTALCDSLARHFWYRSSYLALTDPLPAKLRHQLGRRDSIVRDGAAPPHVVRWVNGRAAARFRSRRRVAPAASTEKRSSCSGPVS